MGWKRGGRRLGWALWLLGLGAGAASAQTPPAPGRYAWETVPLNVRLRIATDSGLMVARYAGITGDTLLLGQCEHICANQTTTGMRLPLNLLGDVFVERGRQTPAGFRAGVLVGAGVGAGTGLLIGRTGELSAVETFLAGTLSGAVVGSAVGPAIGSTITRWRPLARVNTPAGGLELGVLMRLPDPMLIRMGARPH